jgi:hypothetical protein
MGYAEERGAPGLTSSLAAQVSKTSLSQKKSHVMEIQVNGGALKDKVDFGYKLFEQQVLIHLRRFFRTAADTHTAWALGHSGSGLVLGEARGNCSGL